MATRTNSPRLIRIDRSNFGYDIKVYAAVESDNDSLCLHQAGRIIDRNVASPDQEPSRVDEDLSDASFLDHLSSAMYLSGDAYTMAEALGLNTVKNCLNPVSSAERQDEADEAFYDAVLSEVDEAPEGFYDFNTYNDDGGLLDHCTFNGRGIDYIGHGEESEDEESPVAAVVVVETVEVTDADLLHEQLTQPCPSERSRKELYREPPRTFPSHANHPGGTVEDKVYAILGEQHVRAYQMWELC